MSPTQPNASREDIITALRQGHSNSKIMRDLRCDKTRVARLRHELGLPQFVKAEQTRTVEDKWALFARPVDGGHMEWTGERAKGSGTPLLTYKERHLSAAGVAFRIRTGRAPEGYAIADCGVQHCIAPEHVNDEAGRQQARRALRTSQGLGDVSTLCVHGHNQQEHGRLDPTGTAYCEACKREWRRDPAAMKARTATTREEQFRVIEQLLRESTPDARIARQLGVSSATVKRVRTELGLPPARSGRPDTYASPEDAFHANTEAVEGGHVRWTGYINKGIPYVSSRQTRITAARVAFRLHHGRDPEGQARPGCGVDHCVAGGHLEDRRIREANRRADRAYRLLFGEAS
ncbi:hypothetical protein [Streptomyces sp. NPDC020298]|uniref:hypothetical protein n=1 Tax=unclassified Streptomyces TaxID=2593676 RepID=UPI0033F9B6C5